MHDVPLYPYLYCHMLTSCRYVHARSTGRQQQNNRRRKNDESEIISRLRCARAAVVEQLDVESVVLRCWCRCTHAVQKFRRGAIGPGAAWYAGSRRPASLVWLSHPSPRIRLLHRPSHIDSLNPTCQQSRWWPVAPAMPVFRETSVCKSSSAQLCGCRLGWILDAVNVKNDEECGRVRTWGASWASNRVEQPSQLPSCDGANGQIEGGGAWGGTGLLAEQDGAGARVHSGCVGGASGPR
jgi:hypothetical protein